MIRLSIRRPVAIAMLYLSVALLGVAAWRNIPLELLPETQLPRLQIIATWQGASPETTEAFLTSPIEAAVQRVRGVDKVTSVSSEQQGRGLAEITVEFTRDTDMDFARLDLSERLATLEEELPPAVDPIQVEPYVPEAFSEQDQPFLEYTYTGPHTTEALRAYLDDDVVPVLSQIEGVAFVRVDGGREREIEIELDPERVLALGLTPAQVFRRIADLDLVREAGAVRDDTREWTVTIKNRPESVADIRSAVILSDTDRLVRVSDVAHVSDGFEDPWGYYRINGRPAVAFSLLKEIGSNTVRVADRVKEVVAGLEGTGPIGATFILDQDESKEIRSQLTDLRSRASVSVVVIFLVLLVFLRSLRTAVIVFATIAFSILIALNLIYFGGLSLNLLTLMGLAMGFGLIVDNSIVVLENVYRRWQGGEGPRESAESGARQVVLPILASTATTLIVFVPFVYLQGELRVFYVPLAVVVSLTLVASLLVAFTFIPALTSRALGKGTRAVLARDPDGEERQPVYIRFYSGLISLILRFPWPAVVTTALVFAGTFYLFNEHVTRGVYWGRGLEQDSYILINYRLPRGADLQHLDELVRFFEGRLSGMPEIERYMTQLRPGFGRTRVTFPDSLENTSIPVVIKEQMLAYSLGFTGAEVRVYGFGPSFYGGGGSPPNYSIAVLGYNYEEVRDIAEDLGRRLRRQPRIQDVDTNASGGWFQRDKASEFVMEIDRDALGRYGLGVQEFVLRVNSAIRGTLGRSTIKVAGDEIRYDVKLAGNEDMDVLGLQEVLVTLPDSSIIRVGDVVTIREREVLARIRREDQQYERRVAYEFRGPRKLGDLIQTQVLEATEVEPGYTVKVDEGAFWRVEERNQIYMVLAVSLFLIFMVTAALFESVLLPACVLLTVPMALIGVFLIFFYTGASFTREAYVGVIMMGGIVVNNAILLVDQVNRVRRETDLPLTEAILRGTLDRVRPILMTTATTVLGLLPLVLFSESADANIWNALAFALVGGLLSSTLFVLTTTPALYLLFERLGSAVRRRRARTGAPAPASDAALQPGL